MAELKSMECKNCGAQVFFDIQQQVMKCDFCGSTYLVEMDPGEGLPGEGESILLFSIDERKARDIFNAWTKKGLFKPGELHKALWREKVEGTYIPAYNFRFTAKTYWAGDRKQTRTRTITGRDGKQRTTSETEWIPRSGSWEHPYDMFIPASAGLTFEEVEAIAPFKLESARPFSSEYIAGYKGERPTIDEDTAWSKAQEECRQDERSRVSSEVDRINTLDVNFTDRLVKMVYLPVWIFGYRYKDKYFKALINGLTGRIWGKKPVSLIKVLLAVGIVVLVIAVIVALIVATRG